MAHNNLQVAVAVILNNKQQVLVSLRPDDVHQGGLWEFPGGKMEVGESVEQALIRELQEELSISATQIDFLKTIHYEYTDKRVSLHICLVKAFDGEPVGAEGQAIQWQTISSLDPVDFPAANRNIINALKLPDKYMITGAFNSEKDFLEKLEVSLQQGVSLVQMRCKQLSPEDFSLLAKEAAQLCKKYACQLLLNTTAENFSGITQQAIPVAGIHLTSQQLYVHDKRPVDLRYLLSVSCHTLDDVMQAKKIAADILLISPIQQTTSHPEAIAAGWPFFKQAVSTTEISAYALGGLDETDIEQAINMGGQGIAGISCFWGNN